MDLNKIFLKDACPTKMGGQAVMEGIMMRGEKKTALALRLPNGKIKVDTDDIKEQKKWMKIPLVRGVVAFVASLVMGTGQLMKSAEILGEFDEEEYEESRLEGWLNDKFGSKGAWNIMIYISVIVALIFTVGVFIILPTGVVSLMKLFTSSIFWLNFAEGAMRIALFVLYVWAISFMGDIKRVFQYHGAEHKTIHCFENGLELTPENCRQFPTLHPRCGTSFLMFVFIIAFALHFLLGWPSLIMRVISRLLLLPVIAGLSYELLRWAGKSDNIVVKVLSIPGLYLQKITTKEPDDSQLEVAIASINAVLAAEGKLEDGAEGSGAAAVEGTEDRVSGAEIAGRVRSRGRARSVNGAAHARSMKIAAAGQAEAMAGAGFDEDGNIIPSKPRLQRRRFLL